MSIQARPLSFADQVCQHNKKPTKLKRMLDEMEKVIPWKKIMVMIEREFCIKLSHLLLLLVCLFLILT